MASRFLVPLLACALAVVVSGCGGKRARDPASRGCDFANVGPLVGYHFQTVPQPAPTGGVVPDGLYDLVDRVKHDRPTGQWESGNEPAMRFTLQVETVERAPTHTQGRLWALFEIPPGKQCVPAAKWATIGNVLRGEDLKEEFRYAAAPGGFALLLPTETWFYQRRR